MSNFLKGLAALSAIVLAAITISEMASRPDPPPLVSWTIAQFSDLKGTVGPFLQEAREIQEPPEVFSFEYLWYFLLRGSWEIWKVWLVGGAVLAGLIGAAIWVLEGFLYDEDVWEPAFNTFFSVIMVKALLVCGRYVWLGAAAALA